jgi:hypothetical protein
MSRPAFEPIKLETEGWERATSAEELKGRASLSLIDFADHAFHAPAKSGRKDADVLAEILDVAAAWMGEPRRGR